MLKLIASEASNENIEKNKRFGHNKIIGPRPLGGVPGAPPPLDPLVKLVRLTS